MMMTPRTSRPATLGPLGKEIQIILSVQDFLIKLGIKPLMHLAEISTFPLNIVIVRLIQIMNRADKNWAQF